MAVFTTDDKKQLKKEIIIGVVSAIAGGIVTAIITVIFTNLLIADHYIAVDNFDVLIRKNFVDTDLVSADILEDDKEAGEQLQIISDLMSDTSNQLAGIHNRLEKAVAEANDGKSEDSLSDQEMVGQLDSRIKELSKKQSADGETIKGLQDENAKLKEELESRKAAEVKSATLIVDGLTIEKDIPNMVAIIDGQNYYSESVVNSSLKDTIVGPVAYESEAAAVRVGKEKKEKELFDSNLVTDSDHFHFVTLAGEDESFTMGANTYNSGFCTTRFGNSYFYANLGNKYSKMSFKYGHLDGTSLTNRSMTIYSKNKNGQYNLIKTIELNHEDFPIDDIPVELNYCTGIKISIEGDSDSRFGFTDVYLYS